MRRAPLALSPAPIAPSAPVVPEPVARRRSKRERARVEIAKTLVLDPWDNGRLRAAVALGATLEAMFDGYGLTITAVLP